MVFCDYLEKRCRNPSRCHIVIPETTLPLRKREWQVRVPAVYNIQTNEAAVVRDLLARAELSPLHVRLLEYIFLMDETKPTCAGFHSLLRDED
jgi:hypothetical protein